MELAKIESTELDKVVTGSGLAIQEGEEIKQSYIPFIVQLAEIQEQSKKINFDNPQGIDETIARELRLKTVKIRTGASDLKDERKRIFLLKGNLEQAAYNLIAASCKLTEETLTNVEKAREIVERKFKEERKLKRIEVLTALEYDFTFVDILNMPDEQFGKLVLQLENERDQKIAFEKEQERIRLENERKLKFHNERKQILIPFWTYLKDDQFSIDFGELPQESFDIILNEVKKAKVDYDKKQAEIAAENEKLKKAQEEKDKLQKQIDEKKKADEKAQKDAELKAENEAKEKSEMERKAALSPDKDKLISWIANMTLVDAPNDLKSEQSKVIQNVIESKYYSFRDWALKQIETL